MSDAGTDAILLPADEDRQQLIARMAKLIELHGYLRWVNAPLLLPTELYFPDPWRGGEASVRRVTRRLLRYAELDDQGLEIEVFEEQGGRRDTPTGKPVIRGAAELQVWPRKGGEAPRFGVEASALRNPHFFVASMARAVAWRWLEVNGHHIDEGAEAQRLVDIATHYLGFGVLSTDAALRHGAESTGGFSSKRTQTRLGLLTPRGMAFLLGLQCSVRGLGRGELRKIEKHLQANPIAFVREAHAWAHATPAALERLALPPRQEWPAPARLADFTGPLPADQDAVDEAGDEESRLDVDRGIEGLNAGKPVFRVARNMTARFAKASMLFVSLGAVSSRVSGGLEIDMAHIMIAAAVLLGSSFAFGRFFRESRCSEPKCANPLTPEDTICPLCQGRVMGVIDDPKKRLAAEEALTESEHEAPASAPAGENEAA